MGFFGCIFLVQELFSIIFVLVDFLVFPTPLTALEMVEHARIPSLHLNTGITRILYFLGTKTKKKN